MKPGWDGLHLECWAVSCQDGHNDGMPHGLNVSSLSRQTLDATTPGRLIVISYTCRKVVKVDQSKIGDIGRSSDDTCDTLLADIMRPLMKIASPCERAREAILCSYNPNDSL